MEAPERSRVDAIDVRRAMGMLDRPKTEMTEVFAGLTTRE